MKKRFRQAGLSLQELLITMAVMGILAMVAVPTYIGAVDRYRVRGAAEQLFADLQYSKSEAIKRNDEVTLSVSSGNPWSYTVTTDSGTVLKTVSSDSFTGTTMNSNVASISFNPTRGTTGVAGTITFSGTSSLTASVIVSSIGRIRLTCQSNGGTATGC